jgi:activating signal cointegrator 1
MKALSILQPWAQLIVVGAKKFETRSWATKYRGPLLIHAGRRFDKPAQMLCTVDPFYHYISDKPPTGGLIGLVVVDDCIPVEDAQVTDEERAFGNYTPNKGRYAWKLSSPVMFTELIPYQGKLSIFDVIEEPPGDLQWAWDHAMQLWSNTQKLAA